MDCLGWKSKWVILESGRPEGSNNMNFNLQFLFEYNAKKGNWKQGCYEISCYFRVV
jgi:hypothetical protein